MNAAGAWTLLQADLPDIGGLHDAALAACHGAGGRLHRAAWARATGQAYVYARSAAPDRLAEAFAARLPAARAIRSSPLEPVFDTAGAAAGQEALYHYAVEMDPEAGWMAEIGRWYDAEHMPGLAAVPGTVRAMRFLNHGHGPLSLACYDLASGAVLGSPPWLAVRATAWSDVTRPHFTHTKRTLFQVAIGAGA
ncbi:MAG: hypothetical protein QM586_19415 [Xenophilus sp.]